MNTEAAPQAAVPKITDVYIGFNLGIDIQSVGNLVSIANNAAANGARSVTICLTSHGGAPEQALYAYEVLRALPLAVFTHAVGTVQSAANIILMAGENRYASPGTNFLFHETVWMPPSAMPIGLDHLIGRTEAIQQSDQWCFKLFAQRIGLAEETVAEWFRGQRIRDNDFALTNGIIHKVVDLVIPNNAVFVQTGYKF